MKEITQKLKFIISLIEQGKFAFKNQSEINKLLDALIAEGGNPHIDINEQKTDSNRNKIKNIDLNIVVNDLILTQKKEVMINQFGQAKNDIEKGIQLLEVNRWVLQNFMKDVNDNLLKHKLLFSYWKLSKSDFLIDFDISNKIWDYTAIYKYKNIFDITALGLDVPDDFDGKIWSLSEPQLSIVNEIFKYPHVNNVLIFFVNRNSIYYSADIIKNNPNLKETKDILFFKSVIKKIAIRRGINDLTSINVDPVLFNISKIFDEEMKKRTL